MTGDPPKSEYTRRLDAYRMELAEQSRRDRRIADARLGVFVLGLVVVWLAAVQGLFHTAWISIPVLAFAALLILHDRVIERRRRLERAIRFYDRGLARLDDRWAGTGTTGERFLDPEHPYAADLDLFGPGS